MRGRLRDDCGCSEFAEGEQGRGARGPAASRSCATRERGRSRPSPLAPPFHDASLCMGMRLLDAWSHHSVFLTTFSPVSSLGGPASHLEILRLEKSASCSDRPLFGLLPCFLVSCEVAISCGIVTLIRRDVDKASITDWPHTTSLSYGSPRRRALMSRRPPLVLRDSTFEEHEPSEDALRVQGRSYA